MGEVINIAGERGQKTVRPNELVYVETPMTRQLLKLAEHGKNVLLVGKRGVGKTEMTFQVFNELKLTYAYYNTATMDAFADFVGIPLARGTTVPAETWAKCVEELRDTVLAKMSDEAVNAILKKMVQPAGEQLVYIRPRKIDDAQAAIFDEVNRPSSEKMVNAILEVLQFKTINGEPLPNLKICWGAMNPPKADYRVMTLDPAFLDRFHHTVEVQNKPMAKVLVTRGIDKMVADNCVKWWNNLPKEMQEEVSSRRLEYLGQSWMEGLPLDTCLPYGVKVPTEKLEQMITSAKATDILSAADLDDPVKRAKLKEDMQAGDGVALQMQVSALVSNQRFPKIFGYHDLIEVVAFEVQKSFFRELEENLRRKVPNPKANMVELFGDRGKDAEKFIALAQKFGVYDKKDK